MKSSKYDVSYIEETEWLNCIAVEVFVSLRQKLFMLDNKVSQEEPKATVSGE